ncbi:osteoclast-associated immunoglobulin-like receptor isoform X3 [Ambystoma mexicanum]|uniref:osteoclast-associated immunoglobulin-like receptor isoform X3 n=1 Tax=Ambystoma mexicanum TaxID=8296 RepID=UPI0037E78C75
MTSAFIPCLVFSCYLLDRWNWLSLGQGSYPKPTVEVIPGNLIARGGNLTIRCVVLYPSMRFILYRGITVLKTQDPLGSEARFLLTDLQPADEGAYTCRYRPRTGPAIYSDASDIIQIEVLDAGSPPKPTVEVIPGNVITRGGNLTIRCVGLYPSMRFTLYRGAAVVLPTQDPPGTEATFLLTDLQQEDEGAYTCRYHPRTGPTIYSDASDIIQIKVLDYTTSNIIQIVLAAVVLLILLVILVEHCHSSKGKGNSAPESGHE